MANEVECVCRDVNGLLVCFKMSKIPATGSASNQPQAQNSGNQLKNGQNRLVVQVKNFVPSVIFIQT